MLEDSRGLTWIGTRGKGLCRLNDKTGEIINYNTKPTDIKWGYDNVSCIKEDKSFNIWIGTLESGLLKYEPDNDKYERFTMKDGLASNTILAMEIDGSNSIWITTKKGLVKLSPSTETFMPIVSRNPKRPEQYREMVSAKTLDGWLMFGGEFGFIGFYPDSLKVQSKASDKVVLTRLVVNQQEILPRSTHNNGILSQSIGYASTIHLKSYQNALRIDFALLSFDAPHQNKYRYRLQNFDNEWHTADYSQAYASYHSLPGGRYTFEVYGINSDGLISKEPATIEILIDTLFVKTLAFKFLVLVMALILAVAFYYYRLIKINHQRDELRRQVRERTSEIQKINIELKKQASELQEVNLQLEERQQQIREQSDELYAQKEELVSQQAALRLSNAMKDRLFSIVAHDIKSPFSSILGFSELLTQQYDDFDDESRKRNIQLLYETSKSVGNLLDNLLYWARAQQGPLQVQKVRVDLHEITLEVFDLFKTQAFNKSNRLVNNLPNPLYVIADLNMMHTVIRNLVSNANKYCDHGEIKISIDKLTSSFMYINVSDTGTGIPEEHFHDLFNAAHPTSMYGTKGEKGTGLGLLICKEFIEAHGGTIEVKNRIDKGACITFSIPVAKKDE